MKHLIYLNKEYLYSYYAQAFDGIDESHQKGVTDATAQAEQHISESVGHNTNFSMTLPAIASFSAGKSTTDESVNSTFYNVEASRDYANVVLHDNALNRIIEHSRADEHTDGEIGKYVIEKGHFTILDMQYLEELTTPNIVNFMAEKTWEEHLTTLTNPQSEAVQKGKKAFIANEKNTLTSANEQFQVIKALAMFDVLLVVNGKLVPLKYQYMKETTKEIVFKYESEVFVFGKVTRKNKAMLNNCMGLLGNLNQSFSSMWFVLLKALGLKPDQNYTVIDPIAIYVE